MGWYGLIFNQHVPALREADGDRCCGWLLRAVLDENTGLCTEHRLSHLFHMTVPRQSRVLYITDATVNVAPDAATLCEIIMNAVGMVHRLDLAVPKVAILSATEVVDASLPSSVIARDGDCFGAWV